MRRPRILLMICLLTSTPLFAQMSDSNTTPSSTTSTLSLSPQEERAIMGVITIIGFLYVNQISTDDLMDSDLPLDNNNGTQVQTESIKNANVEISPSGTITIQFDNLKMGTIKELLMANFLEDFHAQLPPFSRISGFVEVDELANLKINVKLAEGEVKTLDLFLSSQEVESLIDRQGGF